MHWHDMAARVTKVAITGLAITASYPPVISAAPPAPAANPPLTAAVSEHRHPPPPPLQPGMHVERQMLTPSGNLRVRYLRDREHNLRQVSIQDAHNPANETVLAQFKRNAWLVVSPNDDWIVLQNRDRAARGVQLFHRVSLTPLKYEVPAELQANGSSLQERIWESYLQATQQDSPDPGQVTIDATSWAPDSQKVTFTITPVPTKNSAAGPAAWSCLFDVKAKQVEPAAEEVAEGPQDQPENGAPAEMTSDESAGVTGEDSAAGEETGGAEADQPPQELEGEKFPATRQEEITVEDANELELADVKYAIFEMFARHGAEMQDAKMKATFSEFPWYQPQPGLSFDKAEKEFSEIEKHNLAVLRRAREAKIAAARRPERRAIRGEQVEEPSGEQVIQGVLQGVSDALGHP